MPVDLHDNPEGSQVRKHPIQRKTFFHVKFALGVLVFAAAVAGHITVAVHFVDQQPDDSKLYTQLARNVMEQGVFSGDFTPPYSPTLIRTPGYPFFLLTVYDLFGIGNETAVRVSQALIFTLTCIFAALIASQWVEDKSRKTRAAWTAFILAAFCPFTAIFSATILCETLTMFFLAAMTLAATYAFKFRKRRRSFIWWAVAGLLAGISVLFRPDAGLFAFGIGLTLVFSLFFGRGSFRTRLADRFWKGIVFTALFALPLVPWTIRNERLFGVFQPLAPAHAEMPGEFVPRGYSLWLRTWIDDSKYIDPLIWGLEQKPLRIENMTLSAFSSDDERQRIAALFDQYNNSDPDHPAVPVKKADDADSDDNDNGDDSSDSDKTDNNNSSGDSSDDDKADDGELNLKISSEVDAGFEQIARERIERGPWRFYVGLPAKRAASMWFDTHSDYYPFGGELLPLTDLDNDKDQQYWLPLFAGLDWLYTLLAFAGALLLLLIRGAAVKTMAVPRFGDQCAPNSIFRNDRKSGAAISGRAFYSCGDPRRNFSVIPAIKRETSAIGLELYYGKD